MDSPGRNVNPQTGLPTYCNGLNGATILKVSERDASDDTHKQSIDLKLPDNDEYNNILFAGTLKDFENDTPGFIQFKGITAKEAVGKKILSTGLVLWRSSGPIFVERLLSGSSIPPALNGPNKPKSREEMSPCWALMGGGMFYTTRDREGTAPAGAVEMVADGDDWGAEWAVHTFKDKSDTAKAQKKADADLDARKCRCGNFKTPNYADGLCNACRGTAGSPAADVVGRTAANAALNRVTPFKRSRTEEEEEAENKYADIKSCPKCEKDLSSLGPLRKLRHVTRCSPAAGSLDKNVIEEID